MARIVMRRFNLLSVDVHPIFSLGVEMLLKEASKFLCLGTVTDASTAFEHAHRLSPDIIVLDLIFDKWEGLSLIVVLLEAAPAARIVIYSTLEEKVYARKAFEVGASGYVVKEAGLMALPSVAAGYPFVSEAVKQTMLDEAIGQRTGRSLSGMAILSHHELCVLRLLGSAEVATKLGVSTSTGGTYCDRIRNRLVLHTAGEVELHAEALFHTSFTRFELEPREDAPGEGHFG